jgi:peptidoglycan/LPS O-acetylase OafA/YrhL
MQLSHQANFTGLGIMPPRSARRHGQLGALTGLRFFAALAVVFYHVPFVLPQSVSLTLLPDGALGVSFFFILSGFILTHVYGDTALAKLGFYRKRLARIVPLHLLTFAVWTMLFFNTWGNSLQDKLNSGITNILLLQAFFSGPLFNLGYNAVSWSISVEAFFYLMFPLIIARKLQLPLAIAYAVLICFLPNRIVQILNIGFPSFFYFNPFARLLEFSFGMALYSFYQKCEISKSWASVSQFCSLGALSWLVSISATLDTHYRNVVLLLPFGFLIISFARDGFLSKIMASTFFVILGDSSFALYMVHHMFFRTVDPLLLNLHSPVLTLLIVLPSVVVLSVLVHFLFERPVRSLLSESWTREARVGTLPTDNKTTI